MIEIETNLTAEEISTLLNAIITKDDLNGHKISNRLIIKSIVDDTFLMSIIRLEPQLFVPIYLDKIGEYQEALCSIDNIFDDKHYSKGFNYVFADALHLANHYTDALNVLNKEQNSTHYQYISLKAHIKKHLGNFNEALEILNNAIENDSKHELTFRKRKFSILYLEYLNEQLDKNLDKIVSFEEIEKELEHLETDIHTDIYKAALLARKNPIKALALIEQSINIFEKLDDRYIYNAYYIKAEILRVLNRFDEAYYYYGLSSGIYTDHIDINLIDQNYFSARYLELSNLVKGTLSEQLYNKRVELTGKRKCELKGENYSSEFLGYIGDTINNDDLEKLKFNNLLLATINECSTKDKQEELNEIMLNNIFIIL